MFSIVALLLLGLVLVLIGAEALVDGASALARKLGVSEFVIGLTIVALGTSAPEMVVSFIASFQNNSDMAVGNIFGSNIFNTALILGLSAVICPIDITKDQLRRDIPTNVGVTLLLIFFGMRNTVFGIGWNGMGRPEGILFIALFCWYMAKSFANGKNDCQDEQSQTLGTVRSVLYILCGLAALVFGGRLFVNNAESVAKALGWSDTFIAITILAAGTSMPELATSVIAAVKGKGQLALGNIIGSNTSNILLILGGSAIINPMDMNGISAYDCLVLVVCSLSLAVCAFTNRKRKLDRLEGSILLVIEVAYMWYLINGI